MVRLLTVDDVCRISREVGIQTIFKDLIDRLERDFARWHQFQKMARIATHYPQGVIELMPISDDEFYAYKFVNGHPDNPSLDRQTVTAVGMLADVATGYPLMLSEMTLLTAMRTAAVSGLASKYMANPGSHTMGMIGTGSQAEFQALAHHVAVGTHTIQYYDIDPAAMEKFSNNLSAFDIACIPCEGALKTIQNMSIVTTATAKKAKVNILAHDWIQPGVHINAVGGDCPGKTEIDHALLTRAKIVVEYLPQTMQEGEIQNLSEDEVHAELWELICREKPGRTDPSEITLFDSVGFALEDYSILTYFYELASKNDVGRVVEMVPHLRDPKNLFGLLSR